MSTASKLPYWPALNGIRAVSVGVVILSHAIPGYVPGGGLGVTAFFVLSGFLITSILLSETDRTGRIDYRSFYLRRLTRLGPALLLMLAVVLCLGPLMTRHPLGEIARAALASATYTMNWVRAFDLGPQALLGHTWSLAIEEQFYLLWPLILVGLLSVTSRKGALVATAGLAVASLLWRWWLYAHGASIERLYNGFDTNADPILIGCALALTGPILRARLTSASRYLWPLFALGFVTLALMAAKDSPLFVARATLGSLFTAGLVLVSVDSRFSLAKAALSLPPAVWIGRISYGVYLWHYPIFTMLPDHHWESRLGLVVATIATIAIAAASYYGMEAPLLRRFGHSSRRRIAPSPAKRI